MKIDIEMLEAGDNLALNSLFRWLARDSDLRRCVQLSLGSAAFEDTMGSFDIINAVLAQTVSIASLAVSIASWRDSRAEHPSIRVSVDGQSVTILYDTVKEITGKLHSLCEPDRVDGNSHRMLTRQGPGESHSGKGFDS